MRFSALNHSPQNRIERQRGAALLELAIVLTVLSIATIGVIDFGRIAYQAMGLTNAARAGAMVGTQSPSSSGNFTAMRNAAQASAAADLGTITTSASRSCECEVAGVITVMGSCTSACGGTVRTRVIVTASKTFNMITRIPGLRNTVNLSRTVTMRAQ
jgi:Flp pilus assembly protein TadG